MTASLLFDMEIYRLLNASNRKCCSCTIAVSALESFSCCLCSSKETQGLYSYEKVEYFPYIFVPDSASGYRLELRCYSALVVLYFVRTTLSGCIGKVAIRNVACISLSFLKLRIHEYLVFFFCGQIVIHLCINKSSM